MTETPILDSPVYAHGFVAGRYLTAVADGPDADRLMDFTPAKGKVIFTPETVIRRHEGPAPALVVQRPVTCDLDDQGYLKAPGGGRGVALIAGTYAVRFDLLGAQVPGPTRIEVKPTHTEDSPLDLVLAMPDVVPPGSVVVVDETTAQRAEAAAARAETRAQDANAAAAEAGQSAALARMAWASEQAVTLGPTLTLDVGRSLVVVPSLTGPTPVEFAPVVLPDGTTDPDGLAVMLWVEAGAEHLLWPGGTAVSGEPTGGEAWGTIVRKSGEWLVVWNPAPAEPPPPVITPTGGGLDLDHLAMMKDQPVVLRMGAKFNPETETWEPAVVPAFLAMLNINWDEENTTASLDLVDLYNGEPDEYGWFSVPLTVHQGAHPRLSPSGGDEGWA